MVQDRFIPNIIHTDKFCHQIWKITSVAQSACIYIHQGLGTGWLPSNIKIIGIGPSERNCNDYTHVQHGQRSRLQSDSYEKQSILYAVENMHKNSIMGTRCVYNWIDMMVDMGLDKIVHHARETHHARIFNAWIED